MPAPATSIYLPGRGETSFGVLKVDKAVQEYDQNLRFGQNNDTGQWCVFLLRRGELPLPVIGWDEVPHPEDAIRRLAQADAKRRGNEILDDLVRHNAQFEIEREITAKEADAVLAEHMRWGYEQMGAAPYKKIHMHVDPKRQQGGYS